MSRMFEQYRVLRAEQTRIAGLWREVRTLWRDDRGQRFENHWMGIEEAMEHYLKALRELTEVLERAEREVTR